jgi:GNAT superfamily N-acetyltransferase
MFGVALPHRRTMLTLREMTQAELGRIEEIDVSEQGTLVYRYADGQLEATPETWERPRWDLDDWRSESWTTVLPLAGVRILGAFDDDRLVGIAVLRPDLTDRLAQLAALFVGKSHRRQGVARQLVASICQWARETGAQGLYVSATPSESAVGFYLSQGFRLADKVHPELYALEPEDIHLIKSLD